MARYIDADKLITRPRGNNSQRTMWREIKYMVDNAPSADVVPKGEVEQLSDRVMMLNEICESYALQYGTAIDKEIILKTAKSDVAREIFEDIKARSMYDFPSTYYHISRMALDELEKKYTEEK